MSEWKSLKDELPCDGQRVLVWEDLSPWGRQWKGHDIYWYRAGIGFVCFQDDEHGSHAGITHWMSLPISPGDLHETEETERELTV